MSTHQSGTGPKDPWARFLKVAVRRSWLNMFGSSLRPSFSPCNPAACCQVNEFPASDHLCRSMWKPPASACNDDGAWRTVWLVASGSVPA